MPKPFPAEFRRDVVTVARKHEARSLRSLGISGSPQRPCTTFSRMPMSRKASSRVCALLRRQTYPGAAQVVRTHRE